MKITNEMILHTAMEQSAIDCGCRVDDFLKSENIITEFELREDAKVFYQKDIGVNFVSYGNNIVASAKSELEEAVSKYLSRYEFFHCFETPNLFYLDEKLEKSGYKVCFMAEYFLPDMNKLCEIECAYDTRILMPDDFRGLYLPEWSNALNKKRPHLDRICVGAYDDGKLIGLAGCSEDCRDMWQIGIDVLPEYRGQGVASCLTGRLAKETIANGRIPFYCAAWSNIRSVRNALKCGFIPAWIEMTAKPIAYVDEMNEV